MKPKLNKLYFLHFFKRVEIILYTLYALRNLALLYSRKALWRQITTIYVGDSANYKAERTLRTKEMGCVETRVWVCVSRSREILSPLIVRAPSVDRGDWLSPMHSENVDAPDFLEVRKFSSCTPHDKLLIIYWHWFARVLINNDRILGKWTNDTRPANIIVREYARSEVGRFDLC